MSEPTPHVISDSVSLTFQGGEITIAGALVHVPATGELSIEPDDDLPEALEVELGMYGYARESPDEVFVKDWTEHSGLAQALVDNGHAEFVAEHFVGPFKSRAVRLRIIRAG